jgi:hypothetical protein
VSKLVCFFAIYNKHLYQTIEKIKLSQKSYCALRENGAFGLCSMGEKRSIIKVRDQLEYLKLHLDKGKTDENQ